MTVPFPRKSVKSASKSSQTANEWTAQKQLIFPQQQDIREYKNTIKKKTAVEDKLPPSDTKSLGDEAPTVTQQEPQLTQQESEEEIIFDPPEAEEDSNSYLSIP